MWTISEGFDFRKQDAQATDIGRIGRSEVKASSDPHPTVSLRQMIRFGMPRNLEKYKSVQSRARSVLKLIGSSISPRASEASIAAEATRRLSAAGLPHTWYYECPALVLAGQRSVESVPGAQYIPSDKPIGDNTVVTVDLSPRDGTIWGDCARTYFVENGKVCLRPVRTKFRDGYECLRRLHDRMREFVTVDTSFRSLYEYANGLIESYGFENLDFRNNLGHSIETRLPDRRFVDGNTLDKLSSRQYFTFEPHIRQSGGRWGFKHEDIYYFEQDGSVVVL